MKHLGDVVKTFVFFLALFAGSFSSVAGYTLDDISPHFSTNTEIVWKAPMSGVPKSLWIYKKLPRVFSETTISNAIILASFQNKGFPQASTNQITLWADRMDGELRPPYFEISPQRGEMSYNLGDRAPDTSEKVSNNEAAVQRAWNCLFKLGIDRTQFIQTNVASPGTWGVFLPRQIDGIQTLDESEGFSFQQFGDHGKIRFFPSFYQSLSVIKIVQRPAPNKSSPASGRSKLLSFLTIKLIILNG